MSRFNWNGNGPRHGEPRVERIDKNGSKHWVSDNCSKCGGSGYLPGYEHSDGARCWKCGATGYYPHRWIERTEEYQAILNAKRDEKRRKQNLEERQEFLERQGFGPEGKTYIVLGNTFDIKDELKAKGAKFNRSLGWHFANKPEEYECIEMTVDECFSENSVCQLNWREDVQALVEERKPKVQDTSNHVGNIGDKIEIELKQIGCPGYDTQFGYTYINQFEDNNGNILIWKTGRCVADVGSTIKLKGTIKEHGEYNGKKQTILTRCKEIV